MALDCCKEDVQEDAEDGHEQHALRRGEVPAVNTDDEHQDVQDQRNLSAVRIIGVRTAGSGLAGLGPFGQARLEDHQHQRADQQNRCDNTEHRLRQVQKEQGSRSSRRPVKLGRA